MPRIFAYLVGIGAYPDPGARLNGPENDIAHMVDYLDGLAAQSVNTELSVHTLLHSEATRDAVIDGFSFLADAGPEDCVLFYYSGHGSQMQVEERFVNDQDQMQESFVCWDSRQDGHFDLMDKEIAFLLHKYTSNSRPHGVAIIDSCHSGGVMRDLQLVARMQPPSDQVRTIDTYVGHESYARDEEGRYLVPQSDILLLAACEPHERSKETSMETPTGDKVQGIFTYALLRVLRDCGNALSYANLMNKAAVLVDKYSANQRPYLTSFGTDRRLANRAFLKGALQFSPTRLLVTKDRFDDYYLNAGMLHGVRATDRLALEDGTPLKITQLDARNARVAGVNGDAPFYDVARIPDHASKLCVGWHQEHNPKARTVLEEQLSLNPGLLVRVVPGHEGAEYLLRAEGNAYFITRKGDPQTPGHPVFRRIHGFTPESAQVFLDHLDAVARFQKVLALGVTNTSIDDAEIQIDVFMITDPGNYSSDAARERIPDPLAGVDLRYQKKEDRWYRPGFQLCIHNRSSAELWVAGLYMGPDKDRVTGNTTLFAIDDGLMPEQEVVAGGELWMQAGQSKTLSFEILDDQWNGRDTTVDAYIKIFVSHEKPNVSIFNQPGVPIEPFRDKRGRGVAEPLHDWRTYEIRLRVHRPATAQMHPLS